MAAAAPLTDAGLFARYGTGWRAYRSPATIVPDPDERAEALRDAVARSNLAVLRASLVAAGWTAESPAVLDAEGERLAREERRD